MRLDDRALRRRAELATAVAFFTRLPTGLAPRARLADAAWAFPLAGALLGAVAGIGFVVAEALALPALAAALVAVCLGAGLSGALHEDGLADTADALGCRGGRERRLEIMRDSRIGGYGALALVFSVGLRAAALAALGPWAGLAALVAAHAVSRAALPLAMTLSPPARADGLGAGAGRPDGAGLRWALGLGLLVAALTLGPGVGLLASALAGAITLAAVGLARRRFGGFTGDVLGAVQQTAEITMLLAAAALL
jgi:adenosylcobinamide-GDP ribazoletransferase